VISPLGIKGIARVGIVWSCRVHRFSLFNVRRALGGRLTCCSHLAAGSCPASAAKADRPLRGRC
jgi:hypothetical protein